MNKFSTHRIIQLHDLVDRASSNRVAYYCRAIKAADINNRGATSYFQNLAQRWEQIRIRAVNLLNKTA